MEPNRLCRSICTKSFRISVRQLLFCVVISIFVFVVTQVKQSAIENTEKNNCMNKDTVPISSPKGYVTRSKTTEESDELPTTVTQRPALELEITHPNIMEDASSNRKSEKWYSSVVQKLTFKHMEPKLSLLEHPYFKNDAKRQFEVIDTELITPSKCSDNTRMVILILSAPDAVIQRKAIRLTWGSLASGGKWPLVDSKLDIKLLFVVGMKYNVWDNAKAWHHLSIEEEHVTFNDILQLNMTDGYYNLTRKTLSGMKWIHKNCPKIDYVLKADQDMFINVPLIWHFLKHNGKNNSIYGNIYDKTTVRDKGKWTVPESEYPIKDYPNYAAGVAYILSHDAIAKVLHTYLRFPILRIEDAFITGIVALAAGIDRYHVRGFARWGKKRQHHCNFFMDRACTATSYSVKDMSYTWTKIKDLTNTNATCQLS